MTLFAGILYYCVISAPITSAQSPTFAGNPQHTSQYGTPAQNLNALLFSMSIDFNNVGQLTHYGSPLITQNNTVVVPIKIAGNGFRIDVLNGPTDSVKFSLTTDYILPAHNWIPTFNPCIATGTFGTRLYYAGAGGSVWHIDNADTNTPGAPVREVFYTSLANYNANAGAYNGAIFVNTPITADSTGNIYFGFRVQGTAPAPLSTTQSGYARIDPNGTSTFVLVGAVANDPLIDRDSHNLAPALSNDEGTLYVGVKASSNANYAYLLGLNSTTLAPRYSAFLRDPRNNNGARIPDDGTSSPMVGPDGDVYFGVMGNPGNGSRGFLLHFNSDLSLQKTPGGFGWDYTPGVVPSSMVPSYSGPSSYLLFCKYNDYTISDGSGVNRVAILDPNDTQLDPHSSATGLLEMREVLTVIGPTPDNAGPGFPLAVQEFCINAPAVNPPTNSVFFDSEDGHIYRWNLATNSLAQAVALSAGIGQPYVPSVIGPDGRVYTLNGGNLFVVGSRPGVEITITSSSPDVRNSVVGDAITLTATVQGSGPSPTGTVTFTDLAYDGLTPTNSTLAANVPLDGNGHASVTTSSLAAGGQNFGNHFITATYNGDSNHSASSVTMVQKVHANPTTTVLDAARPSSPASDVVLTATVSSVPAGAGTPTGMVTFQDGTSVIGQVSLNPSGIASITRSNVGVGSHSFRATYASDTRFASSSGTTVFSTTSVQLSGGTFSAGEGSGSFSVVITRSGITSDTSSVSYSTSDTAGANSCAVLSGIASSRCDYLTTVGTLTFAAGETSKTISIPIIDDVYAEPLENLTITLSNAVGATLGAPAVATLTITDNETVNGTNPIDTASFFVRQHYIDFLNREPDTGGLAFWTNEITSCGADTQCIEVKRINVSAAFFLSIEFQETGYLVYRIYKSGFGNLQGAPVPVRFTDFLRDTQQIGKGVQVGIGDWQTQLENNKQQFAFAFVQRPDFQAAFPNTLTAQQFVDQLNSNAGGVLSTAENAVLVTLLGATPSDLAKRASVLRSVAEDSDLRAAEFNRAFVLLQYFGYLRRNANDLPDADFGGFNFWLGKLNSFGGNFVNAEMVKAFIVSGEYRQRFGP